MKNNIPTSFQLGGITYTVVQTDARPEGIKDTCTGHVIYSKGLVEVFNNHTGYKCTDEYKELSFYHELLHAIFTAMGKYDLSDDEELVEGMANLLHQFIKTAKYEGQVQEV